MRASLGCLLFAGIWTAAAAANPPSPITQSRTFTGHTNIVNAVAFSDDERLIASGSADKTARIWDAATGKELRKLEAHTAMITEVRFAAGDTRLFTAGMDGRARLWDVKTGDLLAVLEKKNLNHVHEAAISPDGKRALLGSCDRTVELWDVDREQLIRSWDFPAFVSSVAFAPGGGRFAVGCDGNADNRASGGKGPVLTAESGGLWIYDTDTGELLKHFDRLAARDVSFTADGKHVWHLANMYAHRIDARTLVPVGPFKDPTPYGSHFDTFALSTDGTRAFAGTSNDLYYLDLERNLSISRIPPQTGAVLETAVSPSGRWGLIGGGGASRTAERPNPSGDPILLLIDLARTHHLRQYFLGESPADGLAFTYFTLNHDALLTASDKGIYASWDLHTGKLIGSVPRVGDDRGKVFPFDSGKQLLRLGRRTFERYDLAAGKRLADVAGFRNDFNTLVVAPDNRHMFVARGSLSARKGEPKTPREVGADLIEIDTGKKVRAFDGTDMPPDALAVSPDGSVLLAGVAKSSIRAPSLAAWDVATAKLLWQHRPGADAPARDGPFKLAVSPSGLVAVTWGQVVQVLDIKDARVVSSLDRSRESIVSMAFDPDGKRVWTWNGALRTWDVATGKLLATKPLGYEQHYGNQVIFRDGKPFFLGTMRDRIDEVPLAD